MRRLLLFTFATLVLLAGVGAACGGDDATEYIVTVRFNETVTQADMDEVAAFLRTYDDNLDFLIQESFPPTGVAYVRTDDEGFCAAAESELEAKTYVESVACAEEGEEIPVGSPDQPVTYP
jgi:hypothetical protein